MARIELQQSVLDLLKNLRGLEPLKQLFWSELNYERVNQPLSRRGWTDTAASALAEDPVLFASGGENKDFHVIYARLPSDRLLLAQERPIVSRLMHDHPYALFVISNVTQDRWHFLNIKYDEGVAKRRLFRRITIGPEERLRTASERVSLLDLTELSALSPLAVQERHDEAFDVEAVQKDFFRVFAELYDKVAEDIEKVHGLEKESGKLAQLLLNRMIFLYFIQKKGWLDQKQDYLYSRFQECWKMDPKGSSYYSTVLYPLFISLSNPAMKIDTVGAVPFLNGGLFEEVAKQTQVERLQQARLQIKNATFKAIFDDLLERFNFTVTEDTPLDIEVAIDPEMLGKIFESLILQLKKDPDKDLRKLTGSYYTPRPIVHFMCQEALKEYLITQLLGNDTTKAEIVREKVGKLISLPPADYLDDEQAKTLVELFTDTEAKILRQAILDCRVCDPAVGSGAFPVGMLHEMVAAIARLDLRLHGKNILSRRNYDYDLKKQIIESSLYGVDIQEQAVRLCELRLWLSLIVDYQVDANKPFDKAISDVPSLPNLSYRIVRGDSLIEHLFGFIVQLDEMAKDAKTKQLIQSIQADKQAYFREGNTGEKRRLELKILAKQADLAERLIEAKRAAVKGYSIGMFGEEAMTKKERVAKIEYEAQIKELDSLKKKVAEARAKFERFTGQKKPIVEGDFETLRRKFFQTGEAPTFMWRVDFAEVFGEKGGFDVVIANPPYVNALEFVKFNSPTYRDALNNNFVTAKGAYDLYVVFFERGISCLRSGGILAYISPNKWLSAKYAIGMRDFILGNSRLVSFVDISGIRIFEEAAVYPILSFLQSGTSSQYSVSILLPKKRNLPEFDLSQYEVGRISSEILTMLPEKIMGFVLSTNAPLLFKLIRGATQLSDLGNVNATTTASEADEYGRSLTNTKTKGALKVVNTGTIDKYRSLWGIRHMTHAGQKFLNPYLPLEKAGVSERRRNMYSSPKIIYAKMAKECEAFFDSKGEYASLNTNCFYGPGDEISLEYVCAFCNCKLFMFLYRQFFGALRMSGGYFQFQAPQLRVIPLKKIPRKQQERFRELVQQIISTGDDEQKSESRSEEIKKLDLLFYRLYELDQMEIKVIEEDV